ncbi:MAG: ribonucleoside-diphosphate reductase [Alicyclobacillus sp.]|nr:ribonucleoside-diphosphate reductase [Alicyclobacillus sp.]
MEESMLPFTDEDRLGATGERIVADRYLLKDVRKETLQVGSLVVAVLDKKRAYHELARVVELDEEHHTVTVELKDGHREVLPHHQVDVLLETSPRQMWRRVAAGAAAVTRDPEHWAGRFYQLQTGWKYVPGGRINASLGTGMQVTSYNCFVIPSVGPTMRDYAESFGQTLEIQARSGGVGMNLSRIPPQGTYIPVFSGSRRPYLHLVLDVWHPDLPEFLQAEYPHSTKVVRVSREFLRAVEEDAPWRMGFPETSVDGYDDRWTGRLEDWLEEGLPVNWQEPIPARRLYESILSSGALVLSDVIGTLLVPGDQRSTIASTLGDMWERMAEGKQVSILLSSLRPRYSYVRGVNGRSSGAYSWGTLYDKGNQVFGEGFGPVGVGEIMSVGCQLTLQGGSRRGALMLILNDRHADVLKFIRCKQVDGVITGANISVGISERFMEAKERGEPWSLGFVPKDSWSAFDGDFDAWVNADNPFEVTETIQADALWDELVHSAWKSAEPGVVFLGRANRMSNSWYYNPLVATNPCFHPDTRIATEFGLVRIEDLHRRVGRKAFRLVSDDRTWAASVVVNGRSYPAVGTTVREGLVFPTGVRQTVRVVLDNGMELKVTPDHRLLTRRGWVEAGALTAEDVVYVQSGPGLFPAKDDLGQEWGWFLGWLTGDGWISTNGQVGLVFGAEDAEAAAVLREIGNALSGSNVSVTRRQNGVLQITWKRSAFRQRLLELGAGVVRAHEKRVPEAIFQAARPTVVAFLQALFSADGTVGYTDEAHRTVRLSSASKELLQDTQLLLLQFGIHGKIYARPKSNQRRFTYQTLDGEERTYDHHPHFELILSGNNVDQFYRDIGMPLVARKQARLTEMARPSRKSEKFESRVSRVEPGEEVMVYDIHEPMTHSLIANGLVAHNCGEQPLPANGICNLGAVVLSKFAAGFADSGERVEFADREKEAYVRGWLRKHFDEEKAEFLLHHVKWEQLEDTTRAGIRFQDAVIDATYYPFEENRRNQMQERRVGLGIMGLHDLLLYCGIRYGSEESVRFIDVLMGLMAEWCYLESVEIAKEYGPFPAFDAEKFLASGYMQRMAEERPHVAEAIRKHGVRNVTLMTIAPTGTTGTMVGCSTGCEPYYAWSYFRNSRLGMFEENASIVQEYYDTHPGAERLPDYFVTAMELSPEDHVRVQAALQKWIDSSISKTCNAPNSYTVEDTKRLYDLAYQLGCKGITIYRDGSRSEQVLSLKADKAAQAGATEEPHGAGHQDGGPQGAAPSEAAPTSDRTQNAPPAQAAYQKRRRPDVLYGATYKKETPLGKAYITINDDPEEHVALEIFVNIGKAGSDVYAANEALGRAITLYLRDSRNPNKEAELVKHFAGIGGSNSVGFGDRRITSVPDAIAKALIEHSETFPLRKAAFREWASGQETAVAEPERSALREYSVGKDLCPNCHQHTLVRTGGCYECEACGFSKC